MCFPARLSRFHASIHVVILSDLNLSSSLMSSNGIHALPSSRGNLLGLSTCFYASSWWAVAYWVPGCPTWSSPAPLLYAAQIF